MIPWAKGDAVHTACVAAKEPQLRRRHLLLQKCRDELRSWPLESKKHRSEGEGNAPVSLVVKKHIVPSADQPHLFLKGTVISIILLEKQICFLPRGSHYFYLTRLFARQLSLKG